VKYIVDDRINIGRWTEWSTHGWENLRISYSTDPGFFEAERATGRRKFTGIRRARQMAAQPEV